MQARRARAVALLALLAALRANASGSEAPGARAAADGAFVVETLAEGVHLFRPAASASGRTNSLVVEREDGLLVVDAEPTPDAAKDLLAEIARRFERPVRFLVLTHPHADAAGGVSAFPPSALVAASGGFRDSVGDPEFDFGGEARARSADPASFVEPPRISPTLVSATPVYLEDRRLRVEILPIAKLPAHSAGDALVWIPSAGVVAAGDVAWPTANAFSRGANVSNWIVALNNLLELRPKVVVPLRGPALDARQVRVMRDGFAWIRGQVEDAFVNAVPSGVMADRILESPQAAKYLDLEGLPSWTRGMVEQVVAETVEYRRKHGIE